MQYVHGCLSMRENKKSEWQTEEETGGLIGNTEQKIKCKTGLCELTLFVGGHMAYVFVGLHGYWKEAIIQSINKSLYPHGEGS